MKAFNPSKEYNNLLSQARAMYMVMQGQDQMITTYSKMSASLEKQLSLLSTTENDALRDENERLTNLLEEAELTIEQLLIDKYPFNKR